MQYIIGNWKMNGSCAQANVLAEGLVKNVLEAAHPLPRIVLCPPYPYLNLVHDLIESSPISLGAQDCDSHAAGAFTGDVSAQQLVDIGAEYVILGHSERRAGHQESNALIQMKMSVALQQGLHCIVCVGENREERERGQAIDVVLAQIQESIPSEAQAERLIVAYEPVWAIGTGLIPTSDQIQEMHNAIHQELSHSLPKGAGVPILYGGSVNAQNAKDILRLLHVNGVLVGGASLKLDEFWGIININEN